MVVSSQCGAVKSAERRETAEAQHDDGRAEEGRATESPAHQHGAAIMPERAQVSMTGVTDARRRRDAAAAAALDVEGDEGVEAEERQAEEEAGEHGGADVAAGEELRREDRVGGAALVPD